MFEIKKKYVVNDEYQFEKKNEATDFANAMEQFYREVENKGKACLEEVKDKYPIIFNYANVESVEGGLAPRVNSEEELLQEALTIAVQSAIEHPNKEDLNPVHVHIAVRNCHVAALGLVTISKDAEGSEYKWWRKAI